MEKSSRLSLSGGQPAPLPVISNHRVFTLIQLLVLVGADGDKMLKAVILVIAIAPAICVAQAPDSYGLTSVKRLQFEATLKPENYERNKSAWEKSGNAKGYLTADECQKL